MKHKMKTIVLLSAFVTITLHIINRLLCCISCAKNKLTCPDNHYYDWRFGKVRYTKKGSGFPILLIHDLTVGSSQYEFHNLINELSKSNEVYALDLLGYGLSDKPNMTFTNYLYVEQITDFIKNIIGKKTNILATGDSAPIAVMACHNDSEIIHKMIFINPQSLYQLNTIPSKQTKLLKIGIELPILGTFLYYLLTTRGNIEKSFMNHYFFNSSKIQPEDIDSYLEAAHLKDYNAKFSFSSYISNYTNTNIIHALKEINNSIFIIAGKEKEEINTIADNYMYYNTSIETAYIPNTKHLPHLELPEEVLKHIELFLN